MTLTWSTLRCHFAGRFWDILRDLSEVGSFPESHGSPSRSSNKRVYVPDEPADPPPPDNTQEALPNSRGTNNEPLRPTLTTIPGPQDSRGELRILPAAGSVPAPEKASGLEIGSSPPTTLMGIFGSSAIPITTNDLGRLPLHYGVKFPMDFDFPAIANGWNASGSGRAPTSLGGANPIYGSAQVDGVNSRGAESRGVYSLYPPQEQQPEDLFPWIPYATTIGAGGTTVGSVPTLTTAEAATRPDAASGYVPANPSQTKPIVDQLDSTISSFFGDLPSTSSTAPGLLAGSSPGPVSNMAGSHTALSITLFPPSRPPADTYIPPTMRGTQQPHNGSLPVDAQAYLYGWSNAPQAFG